MALVSNVNTTPATGTAAVYMLKALLITAGWTCPTSGDGTTYGASSDVITSATPLGNTNAWFVLRDPGTRREICFQRGTTSLLWRVKISEQGRFTGGTPGAARVPSATDEHLIFGAGTDASPTYSTLFGTDGTYRFNVVAQNAVYGSTNVYTWYAFATATAAGFDTLTVLFQDALISCRAADTSPIVTYIRTAQTNFTKMQLGSTNAADFPFFYRVKHGLTGATNYAAAAIVPAVMVTGPTAATVIGDSSSGGVTGTRPALSISPSLWNYPDQDIAYLIFLGVGANTVAGDGAGFKGQLATVGYPLNGLFSWPDTFNLTTAAMVHVGGRRSPNTVTGAPFQFPWPNNTVPTP